MSLTTDCDMCGTPLPAAIDAPRCATCGKWFGPTTPVPSDARPRAEFPIPSGGDSRPTPDGLDQHFPDARTDFNHRYTDVKELARGGMGVVYRAFDRVLSRPVAIKTRQVRSDGNNELVLRQQFVREARVAGRLLHPNVIPVFDLGTDQAGRLYYTMRLVEGMNLERCLDAISRGVATQFTEFPLRRLVESFAGICRGVDYAHEKGILHLDLKPQNVLVSGFSEVFVIDWGLAREEGEARQGVPAAYTPLRRETTDADTRAADRVIGTPMYMSPEQSAGDHGGMCPATDVYGLGGILHFILSGEPPNARLSLPSRPAPPLRAGIVPRGRQLPKEHREAVTDLIRICLRALEVDPANRFVDADAMVADVTDWLTRTRGVFAL